MAVMFSPMAFAAPGSTTNRSALLPIAIIFAYPMVLGAAYYWLDWSFFALSPRVFFTLSVALPISGFVLFGYPRIVLNVFRGVDSVGYFKNASAVYYNGSELDGADAGSFIVLDGYGYARDKAHVYYDGKPVAAADPSSFGAIDTDAGSSVYWRDNAHVYCMGRPIGEADPPSFVQLGATRFARDRRRAYYHGQAIEGADSGSFRVLNPSFAADKARIYFLGQAILPGAEASSFELFETDDYGRDATRIYGLPNALFESAHEIVGADRATFTPLSRTYAKDAHHVYNAERHGAVVIANADAASFEVTEWDATTQSEARDKHHRYLAGKRVER